MENKMLVDSHCHLDRLDFSMRDLDNYLAVASAVGVNFFLCPGIDIEHFPNILHLAETHENIVVTVSKHPTEKGTDPDVKRLVELGYNKLVVGVGETGLDYYYCNSESDREYQKNLFRTHIRAAKELNKPLVIHSREAAQDIISILQEENAKTIGGVMHCYTENLEFAEAAMELNFYISFSGIITFKNAGKLREVARAIPLNKMLLETDSPYLAPVPMRGKPNEPAFLRYTAEYMAHLREITFDMLSEVTTENFFRLFNCL